MKLNLVPKTCYLQQKGNIYSKRNSHYWKNLTVMMGRLVSLATANMSKQNYILQDVIFYRLP